MRRLGPPLIGIAGVAVVIGLATGAGAGATGGLVGMVLLGGLVWMIAGWVQRRRPTADGGWSPASAVVFRPAAGHIAASPDGVAIALGRVETRELASSASFGVALGFCLLILFLFGWVWGTDSGGDLPSSMELYTICTHPLAGLVVLAAHRARTRSRRDGTEELFETCPTSQATRTVGHLVTSWFPAVVTVAFLCLFTVLLSQRVAVTYGDVGSRQIANIAGSAILAVGATALGIALARWAPWTLVPVAAVIGIAFGSVRLATAGDRLTEPLRQLSTWLNEPDHALLFTAPHWMAHHLWMLALVGLVGLLALVGDVRRPQLLVATAAMAVLAATAGVAATRPIDTTDAARIAAMINDPAEHQSCVDASGLAVCAYRSNAKLADHVAGAIAPVASATPPGTLAGWTIQEGSELNRADLDPEVRHLLRPPASRDRIVPVKLSVHPQADEGARFWVALTAIGVADGFTKDSVVSLKHQARGVVALWLATRGVDADQAAEMTSFQITPRDGSASFTRPWPDICWAGPTPVTWALTDLDAARELLAAPEDDVAALLHADWARFTNPATSTDDLLSAAGLDPVTPRPGITRSRNEC